MRVGRVVGSDARKLSRSALVGVVVAVVVSIVGLPVALAAQAPSSPRSYTAAPPAPAIDPGTIPGMPSAAEAQERLRERRERRATTAEREARRLSRTRFGGPGRGAALQAARETFGPVMDRPGWEAPQLTRGEQIVGYAGDHLTKLKLPDSAEQAVMYTPYPARVKDDDGVRRPLDLSLVERSNSFVTANAAVDVRLPKALSEGITLGESGVSVRVPTTAATSTAMQVAGKAFWSDVETDVDLLVAPLPEGFETTHLLRSELSSERLELLIGRPATSVLRYTQTPTSAAPAALGSMASSQQRGIEVVQNGTVIATIAPPSSVDADGEAVPTRLEIADDRVTLIVRHRDGDFKYPIAADPVFSGWVMDDNNWRAGYPSFAGWNFAETNASYFVPTAGNPAGLFGNGLYIKAYANGGYCCGQFAHWYYFAPGTSYIYRADLTGINHGASGSNYFSGIANNNGWQKSWFSGAQLSNSSTTLCVSDCGPSGATPGNYFSFGMQMWGRTGAYGAIASLGRAALYLSDNDSPSVTSVSHSGLDSSWRSGGNVTTYVSGSDPGLGLDYGEVTTDNGQIFTPQLAYCGDRDLRCPNAATGTYNYNLDQINEGIHQVKARVRDVVQHFSPASDPWEIKIDRSKPKDVVLSGSAWDARSHVDDDGGDAGGLFESQATLNVSARDDYSGVASIELLIDGQRIKPEHIAPTGGCTSNGCPTSTVTASFTIDRDDLPLGDYPIEVVVRDVLGDAQPASHVESATFTLYSDGPQEKADPSPSTPDDPDGAATEPAPATTCDADPDFVVDDCLPDELSDLVQAIRSEPHAGSLLDSLLLLGSSNVQPPASAAQRAAETGACSLGAPISASVSVEQGRRFGLSDQSSYAGMRDRNEPDIFDAQERVRALNLRRVRLVLPFDVVVRAMAQKSATTQACMDYKAAYTWIRNAVIASPTREPLISFERRRSPKASTFRPTTGQYREAIEAFMDQFPAVRTYTAWNEPNRKKYQPTSGPTPTLSAEGARVAGRYWRIANDLCQRGRRCLVAAGDFLDDASQNLNYRSNYFKGMGSPDRVAIWAYHPYGAILHGPNSSQGTRLTQFLGSRITQGSEIWYSEAGAFAMQTAPTAPGYSAAANLAKQSSDLTQFLGGSHFTNAKVKRFYYYSWSSSPGRVIDSGLVGLEDRAPIGFQPTPAAAPSRPIYCIYRARTNPSNPCG